MSTTLFHDCFDRKIKVGDVLANGQRQGMHGGITVGIVRGFTDKKIVVEAVIKDYGAQGRLGPDGHPTIQRHKLSKTWFNAAYNCFITGMTEADLRQIAGIGEEQGAQ